MSAAKKKVPQTAAHGRHAVFHSLTHSCSIRVYNSCGWAGTCCKQVVMRLLTAIISMYATVWGRYDDSN